MSSLVLARCLLYCGGRSPNGVPGSEAGAAQAAGCCAGKCDCSEKGAPGAARPGKRAASPSAVWGAEEPQSSKRHRGAADTFDADDDGSSSGSSSGSDFEADLDGIDDSE